MKIVKGAIATVEEIEAILKTVSKQETFRLSLNDKNAYEGISSDETERRFSVDEVNSLISDHFKRYCEVRPHEDGVIVVFSDPDDEPRRFTVETPVGNLSVWAGSDHGGVRREDDSDDPCVYIDLIDEHTDKEDDPVLVSVEFNPDEGRLQCLLNTTGDDPNVFSFNLKDILG